MRRTGRDTKLVVESVMLDLLLVVPVRYDTVLNRVLEGQDTTLRLGLVTVRWCCFREGEVAGCRKGQEGAVSSPTCPALQTTWQPDG